MSRASLLLLVSALLQVCLAQPLQVIQEFEVSVGVLHVALDVDKGYAVTCGGGVVLWNLTTGQADQTMMLTDECKGLAVDFMSMQALSIAGWSTSKIKLWDLSTGTTKLTWNADLEAKGVLAADFSAMTAVTRTTGSIQIWDLNTGMASQTIYHSHSGAEADLDRMEAVTLGPGGVIRLWDMVGGTTVRQAVVSNQELRTVAVDFAARRAIAAGDAEDAWLINLDTMAVIGQNMSSHSNGITRVVADFGAMRAITGSIDGTAVYWDLSTNSPIYTLQHADSDFSRTVRDIAVDFAGLRAVTGGDDGQVALWDLSNGFSLSRVNRHGGNGVDAIVADMPNQFVFTGGESGMLSKAIFWSFAPTTTTTTSKTTATTTTTTTTSKTETSTTSTTSTMSTTTATTRTETSTTSTASTMTTTMTMSSTTTATTRTETSTTSTTSTTMTMSSTTTATTRTATTTMVMMPTTTRISLSTSGSTRTSPRDTLVVGLAGLVMLLAWQAW